MTEKQTPAINVSVAMNIGAAAQLTLLTSMDRDVSEDEANTLIDKMFRLADRQKAIADIPDLEAEIRQQEGTLENFERDLKDAEDRYLADKARRASKIENYNIQIGNLTEDAQKAWENSGRHGDYSPKGQTKHNIDTIQGAINKLKEEQERADEDRAKNMVQIEKTRARFQDEIAARRRGVEKRLGVIGKPTELKVAAE